MFELLNEAHALFQANKIGEAESLLLEVLREPDADTLSYLTNHAVTYLQFIWITGESYEKGIAFFTNRIRRYPSEVLAYNYRAAHLWYSAQQSEALLDYSRALELAPDDLWALLSRGQAYVEVKQPEKAVEDLNRALQMLNAVPNVREQNRSEAQAYARNGLGTHGLCSETLVARFENLIFRWTFSRKTAGSFSSEGANGRQCCSACWLQEVPLLLEAKTRSLQARVCRNKKFGNSVFRSRT